jgi:carbon starvation protein
MLAGVALILVTVVLFKMKRERFAWVSLLPTAWLLACTMTAGWQKVFDASPKIGFLAHAAKYKSAMDRGELLAPAKVMGQMQQIVFNDYVDATLCAFFMAVVVSILVYGIRACVVARRSKLPTAVEAETEAWTTGREQLTGA